METQLIYKSSWCTAEPIVYTRQFDEIVDRFIGKVFANRTNRVIKKEGKYFYTPSEDYIRHVARMKKFKYI
jgi:hypothetical protein